KVRFFGNASLSLLTKIASGYWHVADSQTGYRAINRAALEAIDWDKGYKRYGQPNDVLVSLNIHGFRVADVPVRPVYGVGEVSTLKVRKVIFSIGWLLVKLFFKRMYEKYVIRDFHPLVFFYAFGFGLLAVNVPLFFRLCVVTFLTGAVPKVNLILLVFSALTSVQFILFAMWFDMEANKELKARPRV
ncbi:MAG: glycosyltransferase family 2 protein, partial [Silvanigrellales bacterium]|nr:glycosyltransferase family 2 protein [Silvanigrellales bacterium]